MLFSAAHPLVHCNAALNGLATVLLCWGAWQIKQGKESAHGRTMMAALFVSSLFLGSYLVYHALAGSVKFTHPGPVRYVYYAILISHVTLACTVPLLALWAVFHGLRAVGWQRREWTPEERTAARQKHRQIVRWAWPIWIYVSVTGVAVYAMLYHLWPSEAVSS